MEASQNNADNPRLLILGASARAAAMSAARAGFQPICSDLFGDVDLREIAAVAEIEEYPHGLIAAAAKVDPCDWMYVGALENHPEVIVEVSTRHRLLGNGPVEVAGARDPARVMEILRAKGRPVLDVRPGDNPPTNGNWLRKPLRSAAGQGIRVEKPGFSKKPGFWHRSTERQVRFVSAAHYYQRRGTGDPISATFVAYPNRTEFVGATRQLVGVSEWNATTFGYCGSIGPLELPSAVNSSIERMGSELAAEFRLRGLFGLDLLWDRDHARLTEINPRYTASVEILEWATGRTLIAEHAAACGAVETPQIAANRIQRSEKRIVGKAIVYAGHDMTAGTFPVESSVDGLPRLADIPAAGTTIRAGDPICSVLAAAVDLDNCRAELNGRAAEILRLADR